MRPTKVGANLASRLREFNSLSCAEIIT